MNKIKLLAIIGLAAISLASVQAQTTNIQNLLGPLPSGASLTQFNFSPGKPFTNANSTSSLSWSTTLTRLRRACSELPASRCQQFYHRIRLWTLKA